MVHYFFSFLFFFILLLYWLLWVKVGFVRAGSQYLCKSIAHILGGNVRCLSLFIGSIKGCSCFIGWRYRFRKDLIPLQKTTKKNQASIGYVNKYL